MVLKSREIDILRISDYVCDYWDRSIPENSRHRAKRDFNRSMSLLMETSRTLKVNPIERDLMLMYLRRAGDLIIDDQRAVRELISFVKDR